MTTRKTLAATATTLSILVLAATTARAEHREPYSPMKKLRYLAEEVAEDARHVHRAAERRAHHRGYRGAREEQVLRLLHDLDECSEMFAREVRFSTEPYRVRRNFEQLKRSFNRTADYMPMLHAKKHVEDDFDELAESMYVLNDFVQRTFYRAHRTRYDHRRWDRRWQYRDRHGRIRVALPRVHVDLDWPW